MLLEIAIFNVRDAITAEKAGAHRLEVCCNYKAGGLTPTKEDLISIKKNTSIPIFAIIRPRAGNFIYSNAEFLQMQASIIHCKQLQYNGFVLGILNEDNTIDIDRTRHLVEIAKPLPVTFHRAFDTVNNHEIALEAVIQTGCKRILTSCGKKTAIEEKAIKQLIENANNKITIVPGGGIRNQHLQELIDDTNATEFHSAAINNEGGIDEREVKLLAEIINNSTKKPKK